MKKYAFISVFGLIFAILNVFASSTSFTPEQTQAIQTIVHDYLVNNPQVLVEASQALQVQQQKKMRDAALKAIPKIASDLFYGKGTPVIGDAKGHISLVEFFDYRCPHCKDMTPIINNLMKKYPHLRVVYKEWPIFGGPSLFAAQAALAAQQQGDHYAAFHEALMKANSNMSNQDVLNIAKKLGLNVDKLQQDMKAKEIMDLINQNFKLASQLGLQGTPAFVIAKTPVEGKAASAEELQATLIPGATSEDKLVAAIQAIH
ncbi:MAG: thioredoxin domain-containing protein [Legionellales bacterium]|nr:thioredoxin domain-containing protein [Legionellales bacterium]